MSEFSVIAQKAGALVGTKFGSFNASDNALSKKYDVVRLGADNDGSWWHSYQDKDGKHIADVKHNAQDGTSSIKDYTTGYEYSSKDGDGNRFNYIDLGDCVIFDKNKNGQVDKGDTLIISTEGKESRFHLGMFLMKHAVNNFFSKKLDDVLKQDNKLTYSAPPLVLPANEQVQLELSVNQF